MLIHLDDYVSNIPELRNALGELASSVGWSAIRVHALMCNSTPAGLSELPIKPALHGWNHLCEPRLGYWNARHLLETAQGWKCFAPVFKMPWNAMPGIGWMRALRESEFCLSTPYKWQAMLALGFGCTVKVAAPDVLLHPPDLLLRSEKYKKLI